MLPTTVQLGNFTGLHAPGQTGRPKVLCVHGAFSNPGQLIPVLDLLSDAGFPVWAFPLRGHGPGDRVDGASLADYVMDVLAMVRQLDGERPIIVGHSMGGLVALKVAETGNCRAAVLVSAAPPGPVMATRWSLPVFARLLPRVLMGATLPPPREALRTLALQRVDPALHEPVLASFVPESGVALREILLGRLPVNPAKVRVPLLWLMGEQDRLVPAWQMRAAARRYGATIASWPEGGHSLFLEPHGADVARRTLDWMEALDRQPETAVR